VIALNGFRVELNHLDYVDELVDLLGDLLHWSAINRNYDGDARKSFDFAGAYGKRFDVEAAPSEKTGNAG
jgi:hypothetical protein